MLEDIKEYLEKVNCRCNEIQSSLKHCYDCNYRKILCDITDKYPGKILSEIEELEKYRKDNPT